MLACLTHRRVLGWALLAGWIVWLLALWVPQSAPRGAVGRRSGMTGFTLGFVLSLVVCGALLALSGVSPVWFVRG